ncbi:MAG TPA: hypothetical protein VGO47_14820, partial [Chlamydiales bacterium]|nr:hypothetical protein [Chlamydiales bacterium]
STAATELTFLKERCDRLVKKNDELIAENSSLKTLTDLHPIVDAINNWTVESRGHFNAAMQRLEVIHSENVSVFQAVTKNLEALNREKSSHDNA